MVSEKRILDVGLFERRGHAAQSPLPFVAANIACPIGTGKRRARGGIEEIDRSRVRLSPGALHLEDK
jgi:hypothetical protein